MVSKTFGKSKLTALSSTAHLFDKKDGMLSKVEEHGTLKS